MNWRGDWNNATSYVVDDVVSSDGSSWIATAANVNETPGSGAGWNLVAEKADLSGATAGGDLAGTYPNPTIATTSVAGANIVSAITASSSTIGAANLDLTGEAAGGDLAGSYPAPSIATTAGGNIVSAINAGASTINATKLDPDVALESGTNTFTGTNTFNLGLSANSQKITSVAPPTAGTDAANKDYVDTALTGSFVQLAPPATQSSTSTNTLINLHLDRTGHALGTSGVSDLLSLRASGEYGSSIITNQEWFRVDNAGGVLAVGNFGSGSIPATGVGTRMMWYPKKAAFRAGAITIATDWEDANIGEYSVAFGHRNVANGQGASAFGTNTTAGGTSSFAAGSDSIAEGNHSLVFGSAVSAFGTNSVAFGTFANITHNGSFLFSDMSGAAFLGTTAANQFVVRATGGVKFFNDAADTLGFFLPTGGGILATGTSGAIPGTGAGTRLMWYPAKAAFRAGSVSGTQWDDASIGTGSFATGSNNIASGVNSFAGGTGNTASGTNSIAFGSSATATQLNAIALGVGSDATGINAFAVNANATGHDSIALGGGGIASGANSVAIGDVVASGNQSYAFGFGADTNNRQGAFVYGDATTIDDLVATANNQFLVRAAGGYKFFTDASMTMGLQLTNSAASLTLGTSALGFTIDGASVKISNVATPTAGSDAANKSYVDSVAGGATGTAGGDLSGTYPNPTIATTAGTNIVSAINAGASTINTANLNADVALESATNTFTGANTFNNGLSANDQKITDVATPTDGTDAANKSYVDSAIGSGFVQLAPASTQSSTSTNTLINVRLDRTGSALGTSGTSDLLSLRASGTYGATPIDREWFRVDNAGSVLAIGSLGVGSIPATGPGMRMMWYGAKGAFRAGDSGTDSWDDANIGLDSAAFGFNNKASGSESFAIGSVNIASGSHSFAAGNGAIAAAQRSVAIGSSVTANGIGSIVLGQNIHTNFEGSFLFSSTSLGLLAGTANDQFLARAEGGVKFFTDAAMTSGLQLIPNGGLVTSGTTGAIPATGAGTRMMWYPAKSAFRAGEVDGAQWDDSNIGVGSMALGQNVRASGGNSIALGTDAEATGAAAIAIGGEVVASGANSIAMGSAAIAGFAGSFVFGDSNDSITNVSATDVDQFVVRASGGVKFFTNGALTTGVELSAGGSGWNVVSDRDRKENFVPVDGEELLARIRTIPLSTWNYKAQGYRIRHIGPMAQDFRAAFGVGENELTINSIDIDGVNFAGVQALEKRTSDQQAQLEALQQELARTRAENHALEERLRRIESLLTPQE